jgi:hypothetical protein
VLSIHFPDASAHGEIFMKRGNDFVLLIAVLGLFMSITRSPMAFAAKDSFTSEDIVARHLKSIGSPEALAAVKSRAIKGTASARFSKGSIGNLQAGRSLFVSEGRELGIILNYGAWDYPGEYFAFDGKKVTVGYIDFNVKSPLASFIDLFHGLFKEGLWGGALSTAWPLLDIQKSRPALKYKKRKIDRRELHMLEYNPKSRSGMNDIRIDMYFDLETFRHIRTEYRVPYSLSALMIAEKFDDFRVVDGMMLPHRYAIEYSSIRPISVSESYKADWTIEAVEFLHNTWIDPQLFEAQNLAQWRSK